MEKLIFILLETNNSRPKSGGEAIFIGLITGAIIYGASALIRSIKKSNQKENDAKKIK